MSFQSVVNWANALFNKYENDAQQAHGFAGLAIVCFLRLCGVPLLTALLITEAIAFGKEVVVEKVLFNYLSPETWKQAFDDFLAWQVGIAVSLFARKY